MSTNRCEESGGHECSSEFNRGGTLEAAQCHLAAGSYQMAETGFRTVLAALDRMGAAPRASAFAEVHLGLARALAGQGRAPEAEEVLLGGLGTLLRRDLGPHEAGGEVGDLLCLVAQLVRLRAFAGGARGSERRNRHE